MFRMSAMMLREICWSGVVGAWMLAMFWGSATVRADDSDYIRPYSENPYYWQYQGKPVLLLGGTDQDNLFNHPDLAPDGLEQHLDLLRSVGGNYVRNTMSHRDGGNAFAFARVGDKFDLKRWNDVYWDRFERFLRMTAERDIIVQLELWETWDHYADHEPQGGWSHNPFNPNNNVNYTVQASRLPTEIGYNPTTRPTGHNFFHTVPALEDNQVVLPYQQALIDKILSYSFRYPHVLYCINNETGEPPEWGEYWVRYVRAKAAAQGIRLEITDMRRSEDLASGDHRLIQDDPDLYSFIEISQNNGTSRRGQNHYDPIVSVRRYIAQRPRPMNNVKIYGGTGGWGGVEEGLQKFWRNVFAGCATARFHRRFPAAGVGLDETAQTHLKSARMLTDAMNVFVCQPRNGLLRDRSQNEAYCFAEPGSQYAVYFPDGGDVKLDVSTTRGPLEIRWLDISRAAWRKPQTVTSTKTLELKPPGNGHWAVLIRTK